MRDGKRRHRAVRRLRPGGLAGRAQAAAPPRQALRAAGGAVRLLGQASACATSSRLMSRPSRRWASPSGRRRRDRSVPGRGRRVGVEVLRRPAATRSMPRRTCRRPTIAEFYRSLVAEERRPPARRRRIRASSSGSPFEARLQQPDVVILGSLNEGTWPQAADPGPWLNRPMRQALGLPAPEERIGDAAHIFTSLLGVERVYLTRAAKIDGVPTVPSRWLLRLQALLAGARPCEPQRRSAVARLGAGAQRAGRPGATRARARAAARRSRCGRASSASPRIEKWIANPYADLRRAHPGARGAAGCSAASPTRRCAARSCTRRSAALRSASRISCRTTSAPSSMAFARGGAGGATPARRASPPSGRRALTASPSGSPRPSAARRDGVDSDRSPRWRAPWCCTGPAGPFTLKARADRIDVGDGGLVITDYKTGNVEDAGQHAPSRAEAPQLPLEAAIAAAGGFTGHRRAARVAGCATSRASGGEPPGAGAAPLERDVDRAGAARRATASCA